MQELKTTSITSIQKVSVPHQVAAAYEEAVNARRSDPDKIFEDGHDSVSLLDPNFVTLDPDHEHPRHWSLRMKWATTSMVATICFLPVFASTTVAPVLPLIMRDLSITSGTAGALQVSIYLFPFGIGPLFLAPLSEAYGRTPIMLIGNAVFIAFCIGGGFARTATQLLVCRLIAGFGGSAPVAVYGGILSDLWGLNERSRASGLIMLGMIFGPVFGPLIGGWVAEGAFWRWAYWVPAIAAAAMQLIAFIWLKETHVPALLTKKVRRARRRQDSLHHYSAVDILRLKKQQSSLLSYSVLVFRPVFYAFVDPAVASIALYFAVCFGILYLIVVSFDRVFGKGYGHSPGIVGTDLMSQGIGDVISIVLTVKLLDVIHAHHKRAIQTHRPELRLLAAFPGAFFLSGGLFIYGFSALRTHFIVPLIGMAFFAGGHININLAVQVYILDSFDFPASATAAVSILRFITAGAFPLFGDSLYDALGIDWGTGLLAFISLGLAIVMPILYIYGAKLREIGARNFKKLSP